MKKMVGVIIPTIVACGTLASFYLVKNKKNMLDIIIEEIETKK